MKRNQQKRVAKWLIMVLAVAALAGCRKHAKEELVPFDELAEKAQSSDPDVRYEGVKHLRDGAPKHTEAIPLLITALSDSDANVRWVASEGLSRFGAPAAEAVPKLTELLRDPSPLVRASAAHALSTMGAAAVPALAPLFVAANTDPDQNVRSEASRANVTIRQVQKFHESSSHAP